MSGNILESIRSFVEDRKVDESELIGMIGEAVNKVASDWLGKSNLETIFIPERNEFKIYELLEVSSEDGENTISLADAKELDSDYELGNLAKRSIQLEG
ncbi:MAG: NusA N-terminal domain-containing protein, partial [Nitrospinota bacterium]